MAIDQDRLSLTLSALELWYSTWRKYEENLYLFAKIEGALFVLMQLELYPPPESELWAIIRQLQGDMER